MICHGEPDGHSAMARTVGLPVAIATKMMLDGESKSLFIYLSIYVFIYFYLFIYQSCQTSWISLHGMNTTIVKTNVCLLYFCFATTGDLKATGVVLPLNREIYKPLLTRLRAEGIQSQMTTTVLWQAKWWGHSLSFAFPFVDVVWC